MVDEQEQTEHESEPPEGGENPPEIKELKNRLAELERTMAGKDEDIASLKQAREELEGKLTALNSSLSDAVASYRAMVVNSNPEVIGGLVSGGTIESINESLKKAKDLVSRVRQGVEAEISLSRVPAGSPERTSPDLSMLSPREKIQYAIGGKR